MPIELARLSGPIGRLRQVTESTEDARKCLKFLEIDNPPLIVDLA